MVEGMTTKKAKPEDSECLDAKASYRCTKDERAAARKEARRRGMTFSQLVRLLVREGIAK